MKSFTITVDQPRPQILRLLQNVMRPIPVSAAGLKAFSITSYYGEIKSKEECDVFHFGRGATPDHSYEGQIRSIDDGWTEVVYEIIGPRPYKFTIAALVFSVISVVLGLFQDSSENVTLMVYGSLVLAVISLLLAAKCFLDLKLAHFEIKKIFKPKR